MILETLSMLPDIWSRAHELLTVIAMACSLAIGSLAYLVREGWLSW
jgi:hypothetical protein